MKILLTIFLLLGTVGCSSIGLENEKMPETNTANYGAAIMKCMQMIQPGHPYLSDNISAIMTEEQRSQNECIDLAVANEEIALIIEAKNEKKGMKLQKKEFEKAVAAKQKVAEKVVFKSQNPERWVKKTDN
ncbi:hypothetical protein N9A69_03575 [Gammaproteobacteria bacterium]|jgi:hypothetical protein|nr:hypothetical protein [Gammaproteobacteria bacterium]MDA7844647.1 hypothetical protein [Gammaproteobacteria bacterium]MDA9102402.1 hypothetical protein [Gammaproteobacteria bacterium]